MYIQCENGSHLAYIVIVQNIGKGRRTDHTHVTETKGGETNIPFTFVNFGQYRREALIKVIGVINSNDDLLTVQHIFMQFGSRFQSCS